MKKNVARVLCITGLSWLMVGCQTPPGPPPGYRSDAGHAGGPRHAGGQPPRPPLEAFHACEGLNEGEPAGFVMPDERRFLGVCERMGDVLVLIPTDVVIPLQRPY